MANNLNAEIVKKNIYLPKSSISLKSIYEEFVPFYSIVLDLKRIYYTKFPNKHTFFNVIFIVKYSCKQLERTLWASSYPQNAECKSGEQSIHSDMEKEENSMKFQWKCH